MTCAVRQEALDDTRNEFIFALSSFTFYLAITCAHLLFIRETRCSNQRQRSVSDEGYHKFKSVRFAVMI